MRRHHGSQLASGGDGTDLTPGGNHKHSLVSAHKQKFLAGAADKGVEGHREGGGRGGARRIIPVNIGAAKIVTEKTRP